MRMPVHSGTPLVGKCIIALESVENKPCLNKKVNEAVRKLLKEVIAYSSEGHNGEQISAATHGSSASNKGIPKKQGEWSCPKCNFFNFARNVKCLQCKGTIQERIRNLNEDHADMPLKKGDWICGKCNFLNFAKNTRCLVCEEKPSNRELNPGDWECVSCNYINFRRNMVCLKCDHQRPKSMNYATPSSQPTIGGNKEHHHTCSYKGGDKLDFVDNDPKKDMMPGFFGFPVIGGKSEVSQNVEKQEMWRMEMAQQNIHGGIDSSDKSAHVQRKRQVSTVYRR